MRVYEASTRISAEFGGIRDLSRHLSLNYMGYLKWLFGHEEGVLGSQKSFSAGV